MVIRLVPGKSHNLTFRHLQSFANPLRYKFLFFCLRSWGQGSPWNFSGGGGGGGGSLYFRPKYFPRTLSQCWPLKVIPIPRPSF